MATMSKSQIDRLGSRLKQGDLGEALLRELDDYRRSYHPAYDFVVRRIEAELHLKPTGRPAKSTIALIEKLTRESIRLTQMQDIAGCRITVENPVEQDRTVASLTSIFDQVSIVDRRVRPSYGYRAVHVIVNLDGKSIEVQVRTKLQHHWAEFSEKYSDVVDPDIKYGGGPKEVREILSSLSELIGELEGAEIESVKMPDPTDVVYDTLPDSAKRAIADLRKSIDEQKQRIARLMQQGVTDLSERNKQ